MCEHNAQTMAPKYSERVDYLQVVPRHKVCVVICIVLVVTATALFNQFSTPVYEVVTTLICEEPASNILISESDRPYFNRNVTLNNLVEQLDSRSLAEEVVSALPEAIVEKLKTATPHSTEPPQHELIIRKLQKNLTVERVTGSDILRIKMKADDPVAAKIIANTYVEQILARDLRRRQDEISNVRDFVERQLLILQHKSSSAEDTLRVFNERNLSNAAGEILQHMSNVKVIDAAQEPSAPVSPKKRKNLALGVLMGIASGIGLAILADLLDRRLRSRADVEKFLELPALASIPTITQNGRIHSTNGNGKLEEHYDGRILSQLQAGSHVYEAYRSLYSKLAALANNKAVPKSILVTSPGAAEGKTLSAINIAMACANSGFKTLLVDCNLQDPMIHRIFGIKKAPGLCDLLQHKNLPLEKVTRTWAVQMRSNRKFFVFTCGKLPSSAPYEILNTPRLRHVLTEFKFKYDFVILDSPPLMTVTDAIVLGDGVDGVCLVIKAGVTKQNMALRAKRLLEDSRTNVLGIILNDVEAKNFNGHCSLTS
jgi:capsular exopolysaccharide synthesis family protein